MNSITSLLSTILSTENATIEYQIAETLPPMKINSDSSIQFYLECKRNDITLTKYPLIVSVTENSQTITCGALQMMSSNVASTSTQDANRHIFPLAFAITDSKNNDSREWFFRKIKECYGEREEMCIVSNRHESIENAIKNVYANVAHGVCHLFYNIKTKFRTDSEATNMAFHVAAKAYNMEDFEKYMKDLDILHKEICPFLANEVKYEKCTRIYSKSRRYAAMTSNIAKSINAALKEMRELQVEPASTFIYSVHSGLTTNAVDIAKKSCTCNKFDLDELPCEHAMAVIRNMNLQYKKYFSYYFTKKAMLNTYNASIHPLGDPKWRLPPNVEEIEVLPPKGNRKSGRPRKKRFRNSDWNTTYHYYL
ncbi:uncharacterized protein LOC133791645 [Humulus lupulus]|uniref:uncharacterized protein LOC133791645 n=1 Tax=Humulus lupulus TaxID=3486 RepID=UPI002B408614|nr:uncharacterized protein LOC133791645 [Humulus lupulus]